MKTIEEIKLILDKPLDEKSITQHPTKTYLSSIKAIYVTERFNDAFGVGGWTTKVTEIEKGNNGMVVVKVTFEVPKLGIYYECYGGNDNGGENNKNFDLGDAYKGATTDALTKIGSYLGIAIDVFKGLHDVKKQPEQKKPWLNENTDDFKKAVKYMEDGGNIERIKNTYSLSKKVESILKEKTK